MIQFHRSLRLVWPTYTRLPYVSVCLVSVDFVGFRTYVAAVCLTWGGLRRVPLF